jgi:CSLREA domain-containing protein
VRPYLSLPTCAWGYGAIQVTGGSVQVRNGTTPLGPAIVPTPAVATPFPQLPTFATAPMQDGPADLKFLVPGSVMAPSTTARWTATFQISIRYQSKAAAGDPAYGQEQTVSFTTTKTVEQRTRNIGIMFVPLGAPLDGPSSTALLNGLTAFSNTFPYQDGTTPPGTTAGVRLGDLKGVQGGVRYTINPGVINVGALPFCGTAANFDAFKGTLATFRQAWNTGNAAAISAGTVSAADKGIGVINESSSLGGSCLAGYASVTSHEAWIRVLPGQAGTLLGMEFCHTFTCVPPARSDGAYHSKQFYGDTLSGDVDRGYSVIDRTLILRPRTVMRLASTADDPWSNSTAVLERDDYAYMLCQMGGFAARNTPCTTSGSSGTLAGAAAGPTFVMSGTTNDTPASTKIVNAYFETGVAQTTALQGSAYSLVQKNGNATLRTDGVRVSKESTVHHETDDDGGGVEETVGSFSVAFPFNTNATTIEFRKGNVVLWVFNKTDPPIVTSFSVTAESSEPVITLRRASTAAQRVDTGGSTRAEPARSRSTRRKKAGAVNASPASLAGSIAASTLPGSVRPFGFFASLGSTAAAQQATYVVNTGTDPQSPDGVCDATECTLREAITLANANEGLDTIEFTTAGVDAETPLPTITDPVTIDGTQADGTPALIELNGGGVTGTTTAGLRVGAGGGGTTIRRLVIVRFPGPAIVLEDGNNVIERNHIGATIFGTGGPGNGTGILVQSDDNTIGGLGGAGNLISGNESSGVFIDGNSFFVTSASRNRVLGNLIGTTLSGNEALGNGGSGVGISGPRALSNVIGGTTAEARNVISANVGGISIGGDPGVANNTVIEGNYIGTNAAGNDALGNTAAGISVTTSEGNRIGGTAAGAGNVISANGRLNAVGGHGIHLGGANNTVQGNLIGTDVAGTADLGNAFRGIMVQAGGNVIGGTSSAARNVVSGNDFWGVHIAGGTGTQLVGNYIGTSAAGTAALANGSGGVQVNSNSNTIGGTASGAGNVISGNNGDGLTINGGSNVVHGNRIGMAVSGAPLGNLHRGVLIMANFGTPESGVQNTIGGTGEGAGNVIANNGLQGGVVIDGGTRNSVLGNSISGNADTGLGIDLGAAGVTANDEGDGDTGPNNLQNFPVVQTATSSDSGTVVTGNLDGDVPNGSYRLEFFDNAVCDGTHGEGHSLIGAKSITSDGDGNIVFEESFGIEAAAGTFVTATATDPDGNTSEFSACRQVEAGGGGGEATFTVNSANDADDGACTTVHCSLREAINAANSAAGTQTISFAIGSGTRTISPASPLPTITDAVTIDGTTQPGFSPGNTPIIELNGTSAGIDTNGLLVSAGPTTIRGLVINRFDEHGIFVTVSAGAGNTIQGNYIGTNVAGTADLGNGREGIRIESPSAIVGGTTAAARNVASGNNGHGILLFGSTNSLVQGNYAGTNAAGTAGIPNGIDGIIVDGGGNNTIGGTTAGAGNLTSGNTNQGIAIAAVQPNFTTTSGNVVQGNKVGTDASGTSAIPNGVGGSPSAGDGVRVHNGSNTTIGGTAPGAANIIAHNRKGVAIFADAGLTSTGNRVSRNQIHSNTDLGIDLARNGVTPNDIGTTNDLDSGPNNLQNFPVIDSVRNGTIEGRLASEGGKTYDLEFFASASCDASGHGEGARYLASTTLTTDAAGNGSFTATAPSVVTGEWVTATATDPNGNTSEFSACKQAVVAGPPTEPGPVNVDVTGTDDDPGTVANPKVRGTLYGRCGSVNYPLVVDAVPSAINGNQVQFHIELDTEPLCADGSGNVTFTFRMSDLWQQSVENQQSHQTAPSGPESPTLAILSPEDGEVIRENAGVTLVGSAFDGEDEAIAPTALQWTVTCESGCSGFVPVSGTGTQVDVRTEIPGTYKATLRVTGFGTTVEKFVTYVVAPDSENDGMIDSAQACLPPDKRGPSDDGDGDGIWNGNDPQPCQAQPSGVPYQAEGDFNPDPLPLQSRSADPSVTFYVTLPYRDLRQVAVSTVRIRSIGGEPASLAATGWTIASTGVATAKFDRNALISFINNNGLQNTTVVIEVEGNSLSHGWSFFASDSTTTRN